MNNAILEVLEVVWDGLLRMGPYALAGVVVSALIKTWKLDRRLWVILNRGGGWVIFLAAVGGVFSPLCSCGILPIVVTLLESGSPLGPAMALLISAPIVDPSSIMVSYSALGIPLTIAKITGAIFMGLFAGFAAKWLTEAGFIDQNPWNGAPRRGYCDVKIDPSAPKTVPIDTVLSDRKIPFFFARAKDTLIIVGKFFLIALVIQGIIEAFVPANWIYAIAGKSRFSVVYAALIGIPLPVNGLSAVPIVKGMMDTGHIGFGPAVAFMIAGPVTSIPAMAAMLGMMKKRIFLLYVSVSLIGSIALGYLWQYIWQVVR
ncbi:MAG: permease [Nitrospirota bacterium]